MSIYILLHAKYPCCGGPALFRAIKGVPREVYDRTCPQCGDVWEVERTPRRGSERDEDREDMLVWTPIMYRTVQARQRRLLRGRY